MVCGPRSEKRFYSLDTIPRERLLDDMALMESVATLSWGTLGVAVWRSGRHTPSRGISELEQLDETLVAAYTENLIRFVTIARPGTSA